MTCELNPKIEAYLKIVESKKFAVCADQTALAKLIRNCFLREKIYTDDLRLEKYLGMSRYFPFERLFPWEEFVTALHCCTFREDGMPRWPDLLAVVGRGAGKDGFIAFESFCLASKHHGVRGYDVDICANNEKQALRPMNDIIEVLETPKNEKLLGKFFKHTKEVVTSIDTKAEIKGHTNSPKGKDGLRPGIVIFNEIHQYQNYDNLNVFTTALGKKKHPRRAYITTNGDVRDGPLDHILDRAKEILRGDVTDNGLLPFICQLDSDDEVHDKNNWSKANPSLPYLPDLQQEIEKEYAEWKASPTQFTAFMTKRMNRPQGNKEIEVASWENIKAACAALPNLQGCRAVLALDYARLTDFAAAGFLVKKDGKIYWIVHAWVCEQSADLPRIKPPLREWEKEGFLTFVNDTEIPVETIMSWVDEQAANLNVVGAGMDNFRFALFREPLRERGFSRENKNLILARPQDIMRIVPVIENAFTRNKIGWGKNPLMRWSTNNTKLTKTAKKNGADTGNYFYEKIEAKSRKNDPFMAFVAGMIAGEEFLTDAPTEFIALPMITA